MDTGYVKWLVDLQHLLCIITIDRQVVSANWTVPRYGQYENIWYKHVWK